MTSKDLYRLRGVDGEIARLAERIQAARDRATSTVGAMHDAPAGGGTSDKVGEGAAEIAHLTAQLHRAKRQKDARDRYIDRISDAVVRDAMRMVYVDCMSWRAAATTVGLTDSGLRKRVKRYSKQNSDG